MKRLSSVVLTAAVVASTAAVVPSSVAASSVAAVQVAPTVSSAPATPATPRRARGSLSVSPTTYIAGLGLVWRGNIGARGVRRITLQLNINRAGDQWTAVPRSAHKTKADGSFSFTFPAPSMVGVGYRVVSRGLATPAVVFNPKSQDVTLALAGGDQDGLYGTTAPDQTFSFTVDTTPRLVRRPDTIGLPVLQGRRLTLQRRSADMTWRTVASGATNARGEATFGGLREPLGTAVYRVRQEAWTKNGSQVGWIASFPYYVYAGTTPPAQSSGAAIPEGGASSGRATGTAADKFGWSKVLYDYGWIRGESLTSRAQRGSKTQGYWDDYSDGAGRSTIRNGGLEVVSSRNNASGPGDFGSAYVTLRKSSQAYGRWEMRLRSKIIERGQGAYRMVAQLVPDANVNDCSRTITIAEVSSSNTRRMTFGVNAGRSGWRGSKAIADLDHSAPAVAVEVTKNHITWFYDGKVIGVVRSRAASGAKMTMRIGLIGPGTTERNHSSVFSDWVRSFPMGSGRQATKGPGMKKGSATAC